MTTPTTPATTTGPSRPRNSVLDLFDPLASPTRDDLARSPSPECSDKENDTPVAIRTYKYILKTKHKAPRDERLVDVSMALDALQLGTTADGEMAMGMEMGSDDEEEMMATVTTKKALRVPFAELPLEPLAILVGAGASDVLLPLSTAATSRSPAASPEQPRRTHVFATGSPSRAPAGSPLASVINAINFSGARSHGASTHSSANSNSTSSRAAPHIPSPLKRQISHPGRRARDADMFSNYGDSDDGDDLPASYSMDLDDDDDDENVPATPKAPGGFRGDEDDSDDNEEEDEEGEINMSFTRILPPSQPTTPELASDVALPDTLAPPEAEPRGLSSADSTSQLLASSESALLLGVDVEAPSMSFRGDATVNGDATSATEKDAEMQEWAAGTAREMEMQEEAVDTARELETPQVAQTAWEVKTQEGEQEQEPQTDADERVRVHPPSPPIACAPLPKSPFDTDMASLLHGSMVQSVPRYLMDASVSPGMRHLMDASVIAPGSRRTSDVSFTLARDASFDLLHDGMSASFMRQMDLEADESMDLEKEERVLDELVKGLEGLQCGDEKVDAETTEAVVQAPADVAPALESVVEEPAPARSRSSTASSAATVATARPRSSTVSSATTVAPKIRAAVPAATKKPVSAAPRIGTARKSFVPPAVTGLKVVKRPTPAPPVPAVARRTSMAPAPVAARRMSVAPAPTTATSRRMSVAPAPVQPNATARRTSMAPAPVASRRMSVAPAPAPAASKRMSAATAPAPATSRRTSMAPPPVAKKAAPAPAAPVARRMSLAPTTGPTNVGLKRSSTVAGNLTAGRTGLATALRRPASASGSATSTGTIKRAPISSIASRAADKERSALSTGAPARPGVGVGAAKPRVGLTRASSMKSVSARPVAIGKVVPGAVKKA